MHEELSVHPQPERTPSAGALDALWQPVRDAIGSRLIPGASAALYYRGTVIRYAAGLASTSPEEQPSTLDTLYDCASLTKITVTLPLILTLCEQGKLTLDDPASRYLPELKSELSSRMTIRQLLAHTSGLPPAHNFYSPPWSLERILAYIGEEAPVQHPAGRAVYSDLGFILLGVIASRLYDMPLDQAANQILFVPLRMNNSMFRPNHKLAGRIAATEWSEELNGYWKGVVHDENARAMGGVSGHAGLFSTSSDLLRYACSWLQKPGEDGLSPLSPGIRQEAVRLQTPAAGESRRGLGWVLKGDPADVAGGNWSETAFGHTGFTGTSLYIDPPRELAVVLLTNRVHYGRQQSINKLREAFHHAAVSVLDRL